MFEARLRKHVLASTFWQHVLETCNLEETDEQDRNLGRCRPDGGGFVGFGAAAAASQRHHREGHRQLAAGEGERRRGRP